MNSAETAAVFSCMTHKVDEAQRWLDRAAQEFEQSLEFEKDIITIESHHCIEA